MKILFDHLQKTGGTALLEFLRSRLDADKVSPLILHEDIRFAATLLDEFAVVGGHLGLSPAYDWAVGVYHMTVLRDPIERFLSHYSYSRERLEDDVPFAILARRYDVATLLRLDDADVLRTVKDFYIQHFAEALDPPIPAKLFAAIEPRYSLIGISERMDDVARLLCLVLGIEPAHLAAIRVTGNRLRQADLDPDTLTLLGALTAGDRALYRLAATRFDSIVRALGVAPSTEGDPTKPMYQPRSPGVLPLSDQAPGTPRILAAELSCPARDANDCALTGAHCVLAFRIDPGDTPFDPHVELRINNALHQVVYCENRLLDFQGTDVRRPLEVLWRFVCPLGAGLYRCSIALGLVKLRDVYEFSVVQPPLSRWSGLVDLRPTVAVTEQPDMDAEGFAGSITVSETTLTAGPGSLLRLRATIRNEGTKEWRAEGISRVVVSYKLFNEANVCVVEDGLRTMLPARMAPNDAAEIELRIKAPAEPGHYTVAPQFVCERVAWFGEAPSVALQVGRADKI